MTGDSRLAAVILVLLLVPGLVLVSIAAMPRTVLLRGPTEVFARRQDDLLLLGLLWLFVWGLYVVLVYALSSSL